MARKTITISLPQHLRTFVEGRVEAEGFGTVSEYFRTLIRQDQRMQLRIKEENERQRSMNTPYHRHGFESRRF